jgi:pimeloyl-ACP methyl ester carboxylesterase
MPKIMGYRKWKRLMTEGALNGSKVIATRMGDVRYTDTGSGPAVLHSHGSPGGCDAGLAAFPELVRDGFRIVTPSRPGFVGTSLPGRESVEAQADLFAAFLDAMRIDRAALLAWSGGGPPALQFAIRHPDRISCLIMYAAVSVRWDHRITRFEKFFMSNGGLWIINNMSAVSTRSFYKRMCEDMGLDADYVLSDPERVRSMELLMDKMSPADLRYDGSMNDAAQYSSMGRLPLERISCPALILHSPSDRQLPMNNGEFSASTIPGAESYFYEKGGHTPQFGQDAQNVHARMRDFLKANAR